MTALDQTFSALSDPTRRAILARLAQGAATAGELGQPFAITPPAVSRHLAVLEQAGLITRERRGQHRVCRLEPAALAEAAAWIEPYRRFWTGALDNLARHLESKGDPT